MMIIDKNRLKDTMGRPLTQSLFLEVNYNTDYAVYTLGDEDREYKGKTYPSLKLLFMKSEDVVEYDFANEYLLGWDHWMKLNGNKLLREYFDKWRHELELSVRSSAIKNILDVAADPEKGFQASKWLADRGWDKRPAGRPSKYEVERETAVRARIHEEFEDDFKRLN